MPCGFFFKKKLVIKKKCYWRVPVNELTNKTNHRAFTELTLAQRLKSMTGVSFWRVVACVFFSLAVPMDKDREKKHKPHKKVSPLRLHTDIYINILHFKHMRINYSP